MISASSSSSTTVFIYFSGMVSILDEAIGNITDSLKQNGLYDDTVIIFSADVRFRYYTQTTYTCNSLLELVEDHMKSFFLQFNSNSALEL